LLRSRLVRFQGTYLGGVTVFTLDSTLAVELEVISALVEPMEFGRRWVTGHRNTSSLLPAAILGTLSLEGPSSRKKCKKGHLKYQMATLIPAPVTTRWSHILLPIHDFLLSY
jgi:hypothetical protein